MDVHAVIDALADDPPDNASPPLTSEEREQFERLARKLAALTEAAARRRQ